MVTWTVLARQLKTGRTWTNNRAELYPTVSARFLFCRVNGVLVSLKRLDKINMY